MAEKLLGVSDFINVIKFLRGIQSLFLSKISADSVLPLEDFSGFTLEKICIADYEDGFYFSYIFYFYF